jgi:hypothetical protein
MPADTTRPLRWRIALIVLVVLAAFSSLLFVPPFPQSVEYHDFADQRMLWNIPHAFNVVSNVPFILFGLMGVIWLLSPAGRAPDRHFLHVWEWWAALILFACVTLTGVGSTYYHANPNNDTLYWDRLPLTVVFMTFFVMVLAERVGPMLGPWLLVPCVGFGIFGVTYWHWTELRGAGDVRVYALVQFVPLLLLPIVLLLLPARYTGTSGLWGVLAWYGLAKVLELLDRAIYANSGLVSGHTLKHLVAALGGLWLLLLLRSRRPLANRGSGFQS